MKLPIKYIALLVVVSLTAVFAYQAYWLVNLYHSSHRTMQLRISEAMWVSDYNEMIMRLMRLEKDSTEHGQIEVAAGASRDGTTYLKSTTSYVKQGRTYSNTSLKAYGDELHSGESKYSIYDSITSFSHIDSTSMMVHTNAKISHHITKNDTMQAGIQQDSAAQKQGLDDFYVRQGDITQLALTFQRGLRAGLDEFVKPNPVNYNILLNEELSHRGMGKPYRLSYLQYELTPTDSSKTVTDTLATFTTSGYEPSSRAERYTYDLGINGTEYVLEMEPVMWIVLRQMSGILLTSLTIIIVLGFAFWYLIHTLLRQKTLEEMKNDFTNNITHELKTPIAVAYAANDALLNFTGGDSEERRKEYLLIGQQQLAKLSSMVEEILSLSAEQGRTPVLHIEDVPLAEVITMLIEQHRLKAGVPIDVTTDINPHDLIVKADRTHLTNMLSNLIDNAVKYANTDIRIHISARREHDKAIISVQDWGRGIPTDRLPHIFEKFYRVPAGDRHDVKGYGLGLYYVKNLAEQHGGSVEASSEPGKGSIFTIKI